MKSAHAQSLVAREDSPRIPRTSINGGTVSSLSSSERPRLKVESVVLRVKGLRKHYGANEALTGLSFEVRAGEVFGLLGPNGAGKTTAISILATERTPTGGDATIFGHSIRNEPKIVRQVIGIAPQEIALYPMLSAAENLRFFARIYNVRPAELESRIDELLHFVGLEGRRNDYVGSFSGGMKRRLNLATALIHRPKLILLDEPAVGVDPQSREHIFAIVRRLRETGSAVIYTTHYMDEAERLCDRIGILSQGKLAAIGTLDGLLANMEYREIIELRGLPPETDLAAVKATGGACHIERSDGVVRLFVNRATDFLAPLDKIIRSRQSVHLKIAPVSLENIFLHLTGSELRQ